MHHLVVAQLIQRRHELGLTQRELASRMGVAQSIVGRLETSDVEITLSRLGAWCAALDMRCEVRAAPADNDARAEADQLAALARSAARRMSDAELQTYMALLTAIAAR